MGAREDRVQHAVVVAFLLRIQKAEVAEREYSALELVAEVVEWPMGATG